MNELERSEELLKDLLEGFGDRHCEICRTEVAGTVKLLGGRFASLCNTHVNLWHEFISEYDVFQLVHFSKIKLDAATFSGKDPTFLELEHKLHLHHLKEVYGLSVGWLQEQRELFIVKSIRAAEEKE